MNAAITMLEVAPARLRWRETWLFVVESWEASGSFRVVLRVWGILLGKSVSEFLSARVNTHTMFVLLKRVKLSKFLDPDVPFNQILSRSFLRFLNNMAKHSNLLFPVHVLLLNSDWIRESNNKQTRKKQLPHHAHTHSPYVPILPSNSHQQPWGAVARKYTPPLLFPQSTKFNTDQPQSGRVPASHSLRYAGSPGFKPQLLHYDHLFAVYSFHFEWTRQGRAGKR